MFTPLARAACLKREIKEPLRENWWQIIRVWYPNMKDIVYCVPPVHFNKGTYKEHSCGVHVANPVQESDMWNDTAQRKVLCTLHTFLENKGAAAFILSNVEFQNYLKKFKDCDLDPSCSRASFPQPVQDEGDFDVLVIDKKDGIFIFEIKSTMSVGSTTARNVPPGQEKKELLKALKKMCQQIEKGGNVLTKMLSDLPQKSDIKIRKGYIVPNLSREKLRNILDNEPSFEEELKQALRASPSVPLPDRDVLLHSCLCKEEFPHVTSAGQTMSPETFQQISTVWDNLKNIEPMTTEIEDECYEKVVARFCGPLTTVSIYTEKTMPRVTLVPKDGRKGARRKQGRKKEDFKLVPDEARDTRDAAEHVARRFSDLVLLQDQIGMLQNPQDFVHIEGPPGTGKTLMLLMRILLRLDEGDLVWIMTLATHSRSVTHVLYEQVKKMLEENKGQAAAERIMKEQLALYVLSRPESVLEKDYFKTRLQKFSKRALRKNASKICLVLDETGMNKKDSENFFKEVKEAYNSDVSFKGKFSVWSASLEKCGRPSYARDPRTPSSKSKFGVYCTLAWPLRCPPSIQRTLMLVQDSLDQDNVFVFSEKSTLANPVQQGGKTCYIQHRADGFPVHLIAHGGHVKANDEIWQCDQCGRDLAIFLRDVLQIVPQNQENGLTYNDVMIVATQSAFKYSLPASKFMTAMKKEGVRAAVNTTRDEGDAPIPVDNLILVTDIKAIHGLERAVIIIIPEHPNPHQKEAQEEPMESSSSPQENANTEGAEALPQADDGEASPPASKIRREEEVTPHASSATAEVGQDEQMEEGEDQQGKGETDSAPMESVETGETGDGSAAKTSEGTAQQEPAGACPAGQNLTYGGGFSEEEIKDALHTLTEQARRDIFYIGSRAVCQLVIFHHGKNPRK